MNSPPITKTYSSSPKANEILSDFSHSEEKNEEGNPNKENLDPFNKMITPLKQSKFQNYHNSSNRSPLQDITPTLGGKKTKETQKRLIYSGNSEEKVDFSGYNVKFFR